MYCVGCSCARAAHDCDSDVVARSEAVVVDSSHAGPVLWLAPECLPSPRSRVNRHCRVLRATTASDVYMFGGLMFEVLTGGLPPYYWTKGTAPVRRQHTDGVVVQVNGSRVTGIGHQSTLQAAAADGVAVQWAVDGADGGADGSFARAVALMEGCLDADPDRRPSAGQLQERLLELAQHTLQKVTY